MKPPPPPPLPDDLDAKIHLKESVEAGCGEAKLIGVMSAFLQVLFMFSCMKGPNEVRVRRRQRRFRANQGAEVL